MLSQDHLELISGLIPIHRARQFKSGDDISQIDETSETSHSTVHSDDSFKVNEDKTPKIGSL